MRPSIAAIQNFAFMRTKACYVNQLDEGGTVKNPFLTKKNPHPAIMLGSINGRITFYPVFTQEE
jgi:hypothetical protein